jgi:hypothetical protein
VKKKIELSGFSQMSQFPKFNALRIPIDSALATNRLLTVLHQGTNSLMPTWLVKKTKMVTGAVITRRRDKTITFKIQI